MPRLLSYLLCLLLGLPLLSACVEPYEPDDLRTPQSHLVVAGFINLEGITSITLSRTQALKDATPAPVVRQAQVFIQDQAGTRYPLTERQPGTYTSEPLALAVSSQYQLRFRTPDGREYASDLVTGKRTPPIDNITWASEPRGVQLYVSSHDATNQARYYRWRYEETWQFRSAFQSLLAYENSRISPRTNNIYECWGTENSASILLSNTTRLKEDVVSNFPLLLLPANAEKLRIKYSILVKQYAQSPEEYAYWELLRKNTETLGGLYDPLPSQLTGNVRCLTNTDEQVIGYVGATTMTTRRLFISRNEFPDENRFLTGYESCLPLDTILVGAADFYFRGGSYIPVYTVFRPMSSTILGYTGSVPLCVDCRLRGTNVKPDFWP